MMSILLSWRTVSVALFVLGISFPCEDSTLLYLLLSAAHSPTFITGEVWTSNNIPKHQTSDHTMTCLSRTPYMGSKST